jgi:arginyl-tRNA synthetase
MPAPAISDLRMHLSALFEEAIRKVAPTALAPGILLEKPRLAEHGDYACNVALQLAKQLRRAPREIADRLVAAQPASPHLERAEVAGAGFINLFLKRSFKQQIVNHPPKGRRLWNRAARPTQVRSIRVGQSTSRHHYGRGAAYGASLANVLAAGFDVSREFYVNDFGRQMDVLALSTWLRYLELCGDAVPFPRTPTGTCGPWRARSAEHGARLRLAPESSPRRSPGGEEIRLDAMIEREARSAQATRPSPLRTRCSSRIAAATSPIRRHV